MIPGGGRRRGGICHRKRKSLLEGDFRSNAAEVSKQLAGSGGQTGTQWSTNSNM